MKAALSVLLTLVATSVEGQTYCVKPDLSSELKPRVDPNCTETKTWNDFLARQDLYVKSDVLFLFLEGDHSMNRSLNASNVTNLRIQGNSTLTIRNPTLYSSAPFLFYFFSQITIEKVNFRTCVFQYGVGDTTGVLHFNSGNNVSIMGGDFNRLNECNGSYIVAENVKNVTIASVDMYTYDKMSICGDICFYDNISGEIELKSVNFFYLGGNDSIPTFSSISFGHNLVHSASILIDNCSFFCHRPLRVQLGNANLTINNTRALGCHYNSWPAFDITLTESGNCYICNSVILDYNFAVVISTNTNAYVEVRDTEFQGNTVLPTQLPVTGCPWASALSICGSESNTSHLIINVNFTDNGQSVTYTQSHLPTFALTESLVVIAKCQFTSNHGSALFVSNSKVQLFGFIHFLNNTGFQGSAIYLHTEFEINPLFSTIIFENNHAEYAGGAIYVQVLPENINTACPLNNPILSFLIFRYNSAGLGGDVVYGGNFDKAWTDTGGGRQDLCIKVFNKYSFLENQTGLSNIASVPSRVCLCNESGFPDCLQIFSRQRVYPGEMFTLPVVAVGQNFGTATGYVFAQLLVNVSSYQNVSLGSLQHYQQVTQRHCNSLPYSLYTNSTEHDITIVLTATVTVVQTIEENSTVQQAIEAYNNDNRSYIPASLLNFPVYINIGFKACPPAFKLSGSPPECKCIPRLLHVEGVQCHISTKQLERSGTVWIGIGDNNNTNNTSADVLFSEYCPYNYCKRDKINIFDSTDLQCQNNHVGRLCGKCPEGTSLVLGTSQCTNCSNTHLYLIAPFAVSGVALVIFIKLTDITTAGGLINGLILYVNLVKVNSYFYFTSSDLNTPTTTFILNFLQTFVDWFNLDLGIETCFFNGLNGYWKTWLQFVFPVYIWTIALSMILLARYSIRMSRLMGNNSVPVLATLFALSYAKLFRTIITAIKFTSLEDESGKVKPVWSYDGTIDYFDTRHSILFVAAILVLLFMWLPYTCVLLFVQCLQRCGVQKISRFVARIQPFLDAHCGSFKDKHRYWFGALLVARAIPFLIGALSFAHSQKITILSTVMVAGVLLVMESQVYKKIYVSLSESLLLLNVLFLAASALYTSSIGSAHKQGLFTAVSVGIAFLHFIVIVVFSVARRLRRIVFSHYKEFANVNTSDIDNLSYDRNHSVT